MAKSDKIFKELKLSQLMDGEWHGLDRAECVASMCADETLRSKWARYHIIRDSMNNEPVQADMALVSRICSAIDREPTYTNITPFGAPGTSAHSGSMDLADMPATALEDGATVDTLESDAPVVPVSQVQVEAGGMQSVHRPSSWVHTGIAGFALAASVALVTVVGVNVFDQQAPAPDVSFVASNTAGVVEAQATTGITDQPSSQGDSAVLPVVDFVANTNTGSFWVSPDSSMRVTDEERLNMMLSEHIENSPTAGREGLLPYSRLVGYRAIEQER